MSAGSPSDFWLLLCGPLFPRKQSLLPGEDRLRPVRLLVADFQKSSTHTQFKCHLFCEPSLTLFLPLASCPGRPGRMNHFLCTLAVPCPFLFELLSHWKRGELGLLPFGVTQASASEACPCTLNCWEPSTIRGGVSSGTSRQSRGCQSACQRRGHGFDPWAGRIPHATGQLSL